MHIEREMKLDFADVLIRPKRSALPSRAKVEIDHEFTFKHSQHKYRGIPLLPTRSQRSHLTLLLNRYEIPGGRHINDLNSGGQLCPLLRLSKAQSMPRWHHPTCRCESPEISAYPRKRG